MSFQKILILRPRFLGDVVLATGLADVIRRDQPGAQVWYLVEDTFAEALQAHPGIAGVLALQTRRKNDPFYLFQFQKGIRSLKFDAVLDLFGNPRTAQMSFWSGAPVRVGFDIGGRSWAYNRLAPPSSPALASGRRLVTEAFLDQWRALGYPAGGGYRTSLKVTGEEKSHAGKLLERARLRPGEKLAVLSPGASWPAKRWPLQRFVELGSFLQSNGIRPLYLLGPKEGPLAGELESRMDKDWILVNQPSLRGLMAFIEAADLLVANDSGPMHVGPALGTPTLGIFGPGEPEIWFPYEAPHQTAYAEIGCSHCGLDRCPLMACMDHLGVEAVGRKALELASKKARP